MDNERNLIWEAYEQVNENIPLQSQQGLDLHKQLKPLIHAVRTYRDAGVRDDDTVSVHVNDLLKQGVPHENIKHVLSQAYSEEEMASFLNRSTDEPYLGQGRPGRIGGEPMI